MIRHVVLDTGPLVAYLRDQDSHHQWAVDQLKLMQLPLLTCEAVITESCYLLRDHPPAIALIHTYLAEGIVRIAFELAAQRDRVFSLMHSYRSVPLSLADACLIGLLESLTDGHIFTLDRDFTIYRQHGRRQIPLITPER